MGKVKYTDVEKEIFNMSATGRAYLEYNEKVGGEPFGNCLGMPEFNIENRFGGIVGLYQECIKQGVTWEKLLETDGKWEEIPVGK